MDICHTLRFKHQIPIQNHASKIKCTNLQQYPQDLAQKDNYIIKFEEKHTSTESPEMRYNSFI